MKANQEPEECRFQALQAQQQVTYSFFFQLMGTSINAVCQDKTKGPMQSYLNSPPGGPVMCTPSVSVPQYNTTGSSAVPK